MEDYIAEWIRLGAGFIGGCCRTNANDIRKIKEEVDALKNWSLSRFSWEFKIEKIMNFVTHI